MQALLQTPARPAGACNPSHTPGCEVGWSTYRRVLRTRQASCSQRISGASDLQQPQGRQALVCRAAEQVADQSAGAGQISQQLIERMEGTLQQELEADRVAVTDVYGDGRHVSIDIVSKLFEGESSVKRQRMVYKAIWMELQDTVHAVDAMVTKTPAEVAS
ncbi:hypothetical protein WJX74_006019 [Apatococcus lobatus]|uniref:Uncharacterized protein n=1 Tax=Apatococcus lobatus TaxID=904363 RepID=A0AAW1RMN3_9CHLO